MGGDEFAVLLSQACEREAVDAVCRRIVESLAEPLVFGESMLRVTASIGAAICPSQGAEQDSLYKAADVALYEAKKGGRNTWRWSTLTDSTPAPESPPPPA